MTKSIEVQGIFKWTGSFWKRLKTAGYLEMKRSMKIFFGLNVPDASDLTYPELADSMIIDIILDEGMESQWLITDPQKVSGGVMMPQTEQESTNYPGYCVFVGFADIPRYDRFFEPGEHNVTVKAAPRVQGSTVRDFNVAGAVIRKYTYIILDDRTD